MSPRKKEVGAENEAQQPKEAREELPEEVKRDYEAAPETAEAFKEEPQGLALGEAARVAHEEGYFGDAPDGRGKNDAPWAEEDEEA